MYELALFSGAGGGILGGMLCGHTCVGACEVEEYPRRVLLARQRDGLLPEFPIWDDICTFRSDNPECGEYFDFLRSIRSELVISGGFPCQDISAAGKGAGIEGARSGLWGEFARIIGEVRPRYAYVENSPMLVVRGLDRVVCDLAQMGYDARWGVVGADDVGAPHRRKRIWIVAHASREFGNKWRAKPEEFEWETGATNGRAELANASGGDDGRGNAESSPRQKPEFGKSGRRDDLPDSDQLGAQVSSERGESAEQESGCNGSPGGVEISDPTGGRCEEFGAESEAAGDVGFQCLEKREAVDDFGQWWAVEPDVGRVANGVASRVDRLKAIGNGQVPLVAATAWELLR